MNPANLDAEVFRWIYDLPMPRTIMLGITHLATKGGVWVVAGVGLVAFGRGQNRRTGLALLAGLIAHIALVEGAIKHLVARQRPFSMLGLELRDNLLNPESYSFPSGHSVASFLAAWVIGTRFPRWRIPLFLVATAVAFSRVNLGAHYPADVLAGGVLGIGLGFAATRFFKLSSRARDGEPQNETRPAKRRPGAAEKT